MTRIESLMRRAPVIPVLVLDEPGRAGLVAEALVAGGLPVLEVTLRTPSAFEVIAEMAKVRGAVVGAGTVLNRTQLDEAVDAGARFVVSPGITEGLATAAADAEVAFLGGVATASDIMRGLDLGLDRFKFFPATAAGGPPGLKALAGPFAKVGFCPTGGVTQASLAEWLGIPQVLCVGGTWLVPGGAQPSAVKANAQNALAAARAAGWTGGGGA
jgi:2-dehydro-3-deoxyphosphogluconate aldolase/(4S)-4-hydroxy-2-oxoglutarate aldolase